MPTSLLPVRCAVHKHGTAGSVGFFSVLEQEGPEFEMRKTLNFSMRTWHMREKVPDDLPSYLSIYLLSVFARSRSRPAAPGEVLLMCLCCRWLTTLYSQKVWSPALGKWVSSKSGRESPGTLLFS